MKLSKPIIVASLIIPLSACISLGPEYKTPEVDITDNWQQSSSNEQTNSTDNVDFTTSEIAQDRWWEQFNDPILNQLITKAWAQNKGLEVAGLRILEAQAQLGIALGNRYPQSQAIQGGTTRVSPANGANNFTSYSLGAAASWEIDFWGKFESAIKSADYAFQASQADRDQILVLLTAQVVDTYTVIRVTEEQLRIAKENIALQQRSYEITDVLYRNGSDSELDVQQAKTLLLSTQSSIPAIEISLIKARNALSILLGEPSGHVEKIIVNELAISTLPKNLTIGIPADLLRRRPDVRQAELLAMAQNSMVAYSKTALYPSFSLTGNIGLSSTTFDNLFNHDVLSYSYGPSFVWPFLNYDRIVNNVRVQDARLQQALVGYQQAVLQAAREVEDAMATVSGTQEQIALLEQTVASAERSNKLSTLRYKEGLSDYQRVLDSQRALFNQQTNLVNAKGSYARGLISLYKSLGSGWQDQSGLPIINNDNRQQMNDRTNWGEFLDAKNINATTH